jgi:hypothetical protein
VDPLLGSHGPGAGAARPIRTVARGRTPLAKRSEAPGLLQSPSQDRSDERDTDHPSPISWEGVAVSKHLSEAKAQRLLVVRRSAAGRARRTRSLVGGLVLARRKSMHVGEVNARRHLPG